MPVVLTHNENVSDVFTWHDVEGALYHYPAMYSGRIVRGEPFVYYRGVHRKTGPRGEAEYTGSGTIGEIWVDPERPAGSKKAYYCEITDYRPFAVPVRARRADGTYIENVGTNNHWRVAVRALTQMQYDLIIGTERRASGIAPPVPDAITVSWSLNDSLILTPPRSKAGSGRAGTGGVRRSRNAKIVGDWAEKVALRAIPERFPGCTKLTYRAGNGEKPGWDIDFVEATGVLHQVEVKGTAGVGFVSFDLTENEMAAALANGESYWLCLVARCLSESPEVLFVRGPGRKVITGEWSSRPSAYNVTFGPTEGAAS